MTPFKVGDTLPDVWFQTRVNDEFVGLNTNAEMQGKKVILFALPGAFTPTCSTKQLPGFEEMYSQFAEKGIDDIYCLSVNDSFVMNAWFDSLNIKNVKAIPDGNLEFTKKSGFLVDKGDLGFGKRSSRYAIVVDDMKITHVFAEDMNAEGDPYEVSTPENVLENL